MLRGKSNPETQNDLHPGTDSAAPVSGAFLVRSRAPFVKGPNGIIMTAGPFERVDAGPHGRNDLAATGYPFCREPIIVRGACEFPQTCAGIKLSRVRADCAQILVDGIDCGLVLGAGLARGATGWARRGAGVRSR